MLLWVLILNSDVTVDKDDNNEFSNGFFEDELVHSPPDMVLTTYPSRKPLSLLMNKRYLSIIFKYVLAAINL